LGREVEVLVEGVSRRSDNDFTGHTRSNKVVNFPGMGRIIPMGTRVKVLIEEVKRNSLYGQQVDVLE
jgi:tRNA-2-methylthio-N6-dimethylallyladenosine synthase